MWKLSKPGKTAKRLYLGLKSRLLKYDFIEEGTLITFL